MLSGELGLQYSLGFLLVIVINNRKLTGAKMKKDLLEILCCPLCKKDLVLQTELTNNGNISEGSMVCNSCGNRYLVHAGIPRLYITDNEIISISDKSKFT